MLNCEFGFAIAVRRKTQLLMNLSTARLGIFCCAGSGDFSSDAYLNWYLKNHLHICDCQNETSSLKQLLFNQHYLTVFTKEGSRFSEKPIGADTKS